MCIAATHDYDGQIPDKDGGAADAVDGNCDGLCGAKQSVLVLDKDRWQWHWRPPMFRAKCAILKHVDWKRMSDHGRGERV